MVRPGPKLLTQRWYSTTPRAVLGYAVGAVSTFWLIERVVAF
jgi:hypothetical protein